MIAAQPYYENVKQQGKKKQKLACARCHRGGIPYKIDLKIVFLLTLLKATEEKKWYAYLKRAKRESCKIDLFRSILSKTSMKPWASLFWCCIFIRWRRERKSEKKQRIFIINMECSITLVLLLFNTSCTNIELITKFRQWHSREIAE